MKFKLAVGALAFGVVGALALCLLLDRQVPEVEAGSEDKQSPSAHVNEPDATEALVAIGEGGTRGERKQPESTTVLVEATNRPLREAGDDGKMDFEQMRRENQQERIELERMQKAIERLEAEVQKEGRDAKGRHRSGLRLQKGKQLAPRLEARMFSKTNGVPVTASADGGVEQSKAPPCDGDGLIDLATSATAIPNPVNPKPGMVFKGYNVNRSRDMFELASQLEKCPSVKTTVVRDEKFDFGKFKDVHISQGVWEGFLLCKRSASCTILVQQDTYIGTGYALFVNGKKFICGHGQSSGTIDLKAGFNHIKLVANTKAPVFISLKQTGSTREPKSVTPKDMWYDEKPDEVDTF